MGALLIGLVAVPAVIRVASWLGIVDRPDDVRRIHAVPTPRAGGLAVYVAVVAALLGVGLAAGGIGCLGPLVPGMLAGGFVLLVAGLWDDRFGIRPRTKLVAQAVAAAVAWRLGVQPDLPVVGGLLEPLAFAAWVVAVTNAYNLIDGLDGLASSVALVALAAIAVVASQVGAPETVIIALAVGGALLAFLRYNWNPARVFLGDTGSLVVGFWLAVLSVRMGGEALDPWVTVLVAACALPLPFLDTGAAIVRRWLRNRPVFGADAHHIHHRLLSAGFGPRGVVKVVVALSSAIAGFGVIIALAPRTAAAATGVVGLVLLTYVLQHGCRRLAYYEFVEALDLLLRAPRTARVSIELRINGRDVAAQVPACRTLGELNDLLDAHSATFGFARVAVVAVTEDSVNCHGLVCERGQPMWTTVHPLLPPDAQPIAYALVMASPLRRDVSLEASRVERLARALVPALERWLAEHAIVAVPTRQSIRTAAGGALAGMVPEFAGADGALAGARGDRGRPTRGPRAARTGNPTRAIG